MSPRKSRMLPSPSHNGKNIPAVTFLLLIYGLQSSLAYPPNPRSETTNILGLDWPHTFFTLTKCLPNLTPSLAGSQRFTRSSSQYLTRKKPSIEEATGKLPLTDDDGTPSCGKISCESYWLALLERSGPNMKIDPTTEESLKPNPVEVNKRFDGRAVDCPSLIRQIEFLTKKATRPSLQQQNPIGAQPAFAAKRTTGPKRMIYGRGWEPELLGARGNMGSEFLGKRFHPMGSEFLGKRNMGSEFLGKRGPMGSEFLGKRGPTPEMIVKRPWAEVGMKEDWVALQPSKKIIGSEFLGKRNNQLLNDNTSQPE